MLGSISSSPWSLLSAQALDLANAYLKSARNTQDIHLASIFCDDAEISLSQAKQAFKRALSPETLADQTLRNNISTAYFERGKILDQFGQHYRAQASYKKAQKWGYGGSLSAVPAASQSTSGTPACAQCASAAPVSLPQPAISSAEERGKLVEYLFEKALSTLGSLKGVANKPSLFLVYAHDNLDHGQAEAATSKYLIHNLCKVQVKLYSDQTPMGQTYSSTAKDLKEDGKLEDILTNQLCLLPAQLRKDVKPVDKIVVCCSEVLASYLKWADYGSFLQELRDAYLKDLAVYRQDREHSGTLAIRQVVRKFSQEPEYKAGFHHVLTEIAFLQIRTEYPEKSHGIIPVSLTANSYRNCLSHFIPATTVRMEDMPRLEAQTKAGEVYPNQSRHGVLFKVIARLLVGSNEAKTFLDQFWKGYSDFISQLKNESTPGVLEFAKRVDGIFNDIQAALHNQLALTVQQHQRFNTDPRAALNEQYVDVFKQDAAFQETLQLYVQPHGKASLHATDTFDLLSKVEALLKDKEVILLTGDSGAGKTTFNRLLEKHLWDTQKEQEAIPLFISLPSIDKPEHDLIAKALKKRGLSEFQIQTLKKEKQRFVFILDGYDEIRQTQNLYLHNRLNQSDGWQGRLVISCRTEYLGENYRSRFQPNPPLHDQDPSFQEIVIAPFSEAERDQYLEKYVQHNPTGWAAHQYKEALEQPHLKALVSNPFLLRVVLEALPYLANEGKARNAVQLRLDLYEQFVKQWFERNQQRLNTQDLTGTKREQFRELSDDGFARHGMRFAQDLAVHLYTENAGKPVVEYSLFEDEGSWKDAFFGNEDKQQLLRDAWPLIRSGNQYRFIHKSLLEYGVARSLFESFDACRIADAHRRRGSDASVYSFENEPVVLPQRLKVASLAPKHWVGDLGVVRWLTDRVKQDSDFKKQLLGIIEQSKTDKTVREAAANAITILVKAGMQFNGADLNHIQIPGADLSFGLFDSAQLQGVDLRRVNLRNSWLRQANLSGAQMAGVQFGEWAYVQEESEVNSCAYSPDGKTCAMGLGNGKISLYDTSSWAKIHTLEGHTNEINSVVYSPSGAQIASGSKDNTVRLWDAHSGSAGHTLEGHTWSVNSVVYSPSGAQIASGSDDGTVRLWDAHSGAARHTLKGHTWFVTSVVYSPSGAQIASGSEDKTVRLWDAHSGAAGHTLEGHTGLVTSVVYSPSGAQIASGSKDKTVRLWEVASGACLREIQGFRGTVYSVAWTELNGRQYLVSGSDDRSVRQWEIQKEPEGTIARLCWSSTRSEVLTVTDTVIEGVQSLSGMNAQLLKQRGSVGEPLSLGELDTSPGTRSTRFTGQSAKPAPSEKDQGLLSRFNWKRTR